jgi:hypothetical protein
MVCGSPVLSGEPLPIWNISGKIIDALMQGVSFVGTLIISLIK